MSLISEENPRNKSSQEAGQRRTSSKQSLNHRRIWGMKSYQTHEIKVGMFLDVDNVTNY